ncbi:MAG: hypothetical protein ACRDPJ_00260 [Nocardioidaceae bacterium]
MSDSVALTSVVASGLVALGGLVITFQSSREQRRHERRLAFEGRSWARKSDGLFDLVATCRSLIDAIDRPGSIDAVETLDLERGPYLATAKEHIGVSEIGVRVGDVLYRLQELVPIVEVYGSAECRVAFDDLRQVLRGSDFDPRASDRLAAVRRGKVAAIDAKDYHSAATARRLEREVLEDARTRLTIDLPQTREKAERLIDAARQSLEGNE